MKEGVLFVWDRIGDYHLARIKACEKTFPYNVFSADLASSDNLYKWDGIQRTNHSILSNKSAEKIDLINRFRNFRKLIKEKNITVVAMPYGRIEYHVFLFYARLCGIKTIVFSESWYTRGLFKDFLKSLLLKLLGDFFFVSGKRAYNHFTHNYKLDPRKVFEGYSVVDNDHFESTSIQIKKKIICVARYSKEKNIEFLIKAFAKSELKDRFVLSLIGDGPDKELLVNFIHSLGLEDIVELRGWVSYAELPNVYSEAYAAILPSSFEPWGLVINEAMAAGLPILVSNACGCVPDLMIEGLNGWEFDPLDENDCIKKMNQLEEIDSLTYMKMQEKSKQVIFNYSTNTWAGTMLTFVK